MLAANYAIFRMPVKTNTVRTYGHTHDLVCVCGGYLFVCAVMWGGWWREEKSYTSNRYRVLIGGVVVVVVVVWWCGGAVVCQPRQTHRQATGGRCVHRLAYSNQVWLAYRGTRVLFIVLAVVGAFR